jgi:hypothetical protein
MQTRLVFASFLLGLLAAAACATQHAEQVNASIGGGSRSGGSNLGTGLGALAASGPLDRYVEMSGRKTEGGTAFVQTTSDVWAPFDVQVHTGFFDPDEKATADDVRVCLEIDDVGFDVFYDACAQYDEASGLWQAFAGTNLGSLMGSQLIDSDEIELRVEQTGGNVGFYARAFGSPTWLAIASTAFPAQVDPLKAAFGVSNLRKGTAVGFDGLSATFSAPPVAPTGAVAVAADVNLALRDSLLAYQSLDAGEDDFATATAALAGAGDALDGAQLGLAALPESKDNQSAGKHVAKADKGLTKAQEQVANEDSAKALKTLEKVARSLIEAALLLNPQPFPPPPN